MNNYVNMGSWNYSLKLCILMLFNFHQILSKYIKKIFCLFKCYIFFYFQRDHKYNQYTIYFYYTALLRVPIAFCCRCFAKHFFATPAAALPIHTVSRHVMLSRKDLEITAAGNVSLPNYNSTVISTPSCDLPHRTMWHRVCISCMTQNWMITSPFSLQLCILFFAGLECLSLNN